MIAHHAGRLSALLAAAFMLAACGAPTFLSGAASMRVEVEVYKGPLSREPAVQWANLNGLVDEVPEILKVFNDALITIGAVHGFKPLGHETVQNRIRPHNALKPNNKISFPRPTRVVSKVANTYANELDKLLWCQVPIDKLQNLERLKDLSARKKRGISIDGKDLEVLRKLVRPHDFKPAASNLGTCLNIAQIYSDSLQLMQQAILVQSEFNEANQKLDDIIGCTPTTTDCDDKINAFRKKAVPVLREVQELSIRFKAKAFYWAEAQVAQPRQDLELRIAMNDFANLASEYSNLLDARADAMLKQFHTPRQELPLSVYLRDTEPTEFLNLYVWNNASTASLVEDWQSGRRRATDTRVKGIERLFADHNWSNVNTVHANGQGDVRMAFIKDDVGNWNLKSFSNDPGELLDAYTDVGKALIKTAADLASGGATLLTSASAETLEKNLSPLQKAASFGRRIAMGGPGAEAAAAQKKQEAALGSFQKEAVAKLDGIRAKMNGKKATGVLTLTSVPTIGDVVTFDFDGKSKLYNFVDATSSLGPDDIQIVSGDIEKTRDDFLKKLKDDAGKGAANSPVDKANYKAEGKNAIRITFLKPDKIGNDFSFTPSFGSGKAENLTGGVTGIEGPEARNQTNEALKIYALQVETLQRLSVSPEE